MKKHFFEHPAQRLAAQRLPRNSYAVARTDSVLAATLWPRESVPYGTSAQSAVHSSASSEGRFVSASYLTRAARVSGGATAAKRLASSAIRRGHRRVPSGRLSDMSGGSCAARAQQVPKAPRHHTVPPRKARTAGCLAVARHPHI